MKYLFNGISNIQSDKNNMIDDILEEIESIGEKVTVAQYKLNDHIYYSICAIVEAQSEKEVKNKIKSHLLFMNCNITEI